MKKFLFLGITLFMIKLVSAQFRHDNVLYKTVDPSELCKTLESNKGHLLLDVRSAGEHFDTSRFSGYNLGHLDGATNIDIRQLGPRIKELESYRNKPVFVYCSHSQRSRRALKMLADSGFTNLYNVNGGMSALYYGSFAGEECYSNLIKTKNGYQIISFNVLAGKMGGKNAPFILDVRPDSVFRHISSDAKLNAIGNIRGAVNIPFLSLEQRISEVPADRPVVVVDTYGDEASTAAALLVRNGRKNVAMLIEGMERILLSDSKSLAGMNLYVSPVRYKLLSAADFGRYAKSTRDYTVLDIRSAEEYNNEHKEGWRNIGHIRDAVHIPGAELKTRFSEIEKSKPVVVYGVGSGTEVFDAANFLQQNGYEVKVLMGGLFNLRWTSGNVKDQQYLRDFVVDVPADNM